MWNVLLFLTLILSKPAFSQDDPLRLSVYATAGGLQRYAATPDGAAKVEQALRKLKVTGIFLEGRRGDEYVPPSELARLRDYFQSRGFRVAGGIATVPGKSFGVRQNVGYGWLNWEAEKTQQEIIRFFRENAQVFDEIVVDDFYCTEDTSPISEKARGSKSWGEYRRDLLAGLIPRLIVQPARAERLSVRLIIKYPQWYDRFHLFGYAPDRMSPLFNKVWIGTEVRNPETQRMGFVQPTMGYMDYRWIASTSGGKAEGAWFDHIECTAQNFVDQAYQSVLAGAKELTLFQLGDVMEGHPGHAPFLAALPELRDLAKRVGGKQPDGWVFYKPPASDSDENLYLADYMAMLGLPVVPDAHCPSGARGIIAASQAADDPELIAKLTGHLAKGGAVLFTPHAIRRAGKEAAALAGVRVSARPISGQAAEANNAALPIPVDVDLGLEAPAAVTKMTAVAGGKRVPLLTSRKAGRGSVFVLNIRTFSEQDYQATGERLLPPRKLGWPYIPQSLADPLRDHLLKPLGIRFAGPSRVALYQFGGEFGLYNFRAAEVKLQLNGKSIALPANGWRWASSR
ncbi:MAG: hypothetical protein ACKV22_10795 [Bryobacteraceae bacterium]